MVISCPDSRARAGLVRRPTDGVTFRECRVPFRESRSTLVDDAATGDDCCGTSGGCHVLAADDTQQHRPRDEVARA
jgi:hypothetical protein